jgi:hypothetical protein
VRPAAQQPALRSAQQPNAVGVARRRDQVAGRELLMTAQWSAHLVVALHSAGLPAATVSTTRLIGSRSEIAPADAADAAAEFDPSIRRTATDQPAICSSQSVTDIAGSGHPKSTPEETLQRPPKTSARCRRCWRTRNCVGAPYVI